MGWILLPPTTHSYVETLTPDMVIIGDGAFVKWLSLDVARE